MIGVLTSYCHRKIIRLGLFIKLLVIRFIQSLPKYLLFFYCSIERNIIVHIYSSVMSGVENSFLRQYQVQLYGSIRQDKKVTSGQTRACEKPEGHLIEKDLSLFSLYYFF